MQSLPINLMTGWGVWKRRFTSSEHGAVGVRSPVPTEFQTQKCFKIILIALNGEIGENENQFCFGLLIIFAIFLYNYSRMQARPYNVRKCLSSTLFLGSVLGFKPRAPLPTPRLHGSAIELILRPTKVRPLLIHSSRLYRIQLRAETAIYKHNNQIVNAVNLKRNYII